MIDILLVYLDSSQHIDSTIEVRPVLSDMITTSSDLVPTISDLNLPTLSLSAPVPADEDNSDEIGFNLQKDFFQKDVNTTASLPAPAKSVFTNIRERYKPRKLSSPNNDESDPFAFRDDVSAQPLRKRKRISRNKESGAKKKKSRDASGINRNNDEQVWENGGKYIAGSFRHLCSVFVLASFSHAVISYRLERSPLSSSIEMY